MSRDQQTAEAGPLSATDFHVLMALSESPSYGYAIMKAVEQHSGGSVSPDIGSLYRVIARLMSEGWVEEAPTPADAPPVSRGRSRRYYRLTKQGQRVAQVEASRLADLVRLAREYDLLAPEKAK